MLGFNERSVIGIKSCALNSTSNNFISIVIIQEQKVVRLCLECRKHDLRMVHNLIPPSFQRILRLTPVHVNSTWLSYMKILLVTAQLKPYFSFERQVKHMLKEHFTVNILLVMFTWSLKFILKSLTSTLPSVYVRTNAP